MLLNGWKEIADYLHCGIRTVQLWEQRLGLPVTRVQPGDRGPVLARSESLESWIRGFRASPIKHPLRPDIAATLQRAASIRETTIDQLRDILTNELAAGMMLARHALRSGVPKVVSRNTALARQAYDTIMRLSQRMTVPGIQIKCFAAELDQLRAALRKLGEKV